MHKIMIFGYEALIISKYSNIKNYLIFYRRNYENFSFSKIRCATMIRLRFLIREKSILKALFHLYIIY